MSDDFSFPDETRRLAKWERIASDWASAQPPAIPSDGDVLIFERRVEEAFRATGCRATVILGATWRLREIFTKPVFESVPLYCVDWSAQMYAVNSSILGKRIASEKFVRSSWTRYDLGTKVGAILGDKVLDNLPFSEWPEFFDCAARHLPPNGRLILHCAPIVNFEQPRLQPADYLSKWAAARRANKVTNEGAASGFWEDLLTSSGALGKKEDRILTIAKHQAALKSLIPRCSFETEIIATFNKVFGPSINDVWCAYTLGDIEDQSRNYFKNIEFENASDYSAAAEQPVISLSRK